MAWPVSKTMWQSLEKLNIELPYDSAIPLLELHPGAWKTYAHPKKLGHEYL